MSGDQSMMLRKQPTHIPELNTKQGNPLTAVLRILSLLKLWKNVFFFPPNQIQAGSWLPCWDTSLLFAPCRKGSGGDWENSQSWELGHVRGQEEDALHQRSAARGAEVHHPPATRAPLHCCGHPLQGLLPSQGGYLLPPSNAKPSPDSPLPLENGSFRGNYRTESKTIPRRVSVLGPECVIALNPVPLMLRTSSVHE